MTFPCADKGNSIVKGHFPYSIRSISYPSPWDTFWFTIQHSTEISTSIHRENGTITRRLRCEPRISEINGASQNIRHFKHNPDLKMAGKSWLDAKHIDARSGAVDVTTSEVPQTISRRCVRKGRLVEQYFMSRIILGANRGTCGCVAENFFVILLNLWRNCLRVSWDTLGDSPFLLHVHVRSRRVIRVKLIVCSVVIRQSEAVCILD
ncbi:hypothetical protein EDB86DRAFT_2926658 [Lactarius hatsudake]|nr:hypothetical protein EDB86DRAFT_2926658 [Lactarius hatsudake]